MLVLAIDIDIGQPAAQVFSYLENAENNPKWIPDIKVCRWLTPPPIAVGAKYEQVSQFLAQVSKVNYQVVAYEAGRLMTTAAREGAPFPITATRTVEPDGNDACHVRELIRSDPTGFYRLEIPVLKPIIARNMQRDYHNLKMILEGQPSPLPNANDNP